METSEGKLEIKELKELCEKYDKAIKFLREPQEEIKNEEDKLYALLTACIRNYEDTAEKLKESVDVTGDKVKPKYTSLYGENLPDEEIFSNTSKLKKFSEVTYAEKLDYEDILLEDSLDLKSLRLLVSVASMAHNVPILDKLSEKSFDDEGEISFHPERVQTSSPQ